jgi:hypothetical protein
MKKLFLVAILIPFLPSLFIGFQTDGNVYAYMGKLIADGGIPYVDGWDHKGISLYLINALGYGVFGFKSFLGIRILELLLITIAFLQFFNHWKKNSSALIAWIAGIFGIFTLRYFFDDGNLTEEYALILSLLSALFLLKKNIKTIHYALVGGFFIICLTLRANLIAFWIALFFAYIVQLLLKQKTFKEVVLSFLKMGYGAVAVSLILYVYMTIVGNFDEFIEAAFTFNFSYADSKPSDHSTLATIIEVMKKYHLSVILVIGFLLSLVRFFKDRSRFLELLLIIWIPIELYLGNISDRMYAHYFMMWVPLIMMSMVIILHELTERFQLSKVKIMGVCTLLFVACYYVPSYMILREYQQVLQSKEPSKSELIAEHIKANYSDQSLLIWGNNSDIYNELKIQSPINFFYHSIFKYDTELVRDMIDDFTQQIAEKRPQLIVDAKRNGMLTLNGANASTIDSGQQKNFAEFLKLLSSNYSLKEEKLGVAFYELKEKDE